jgi:hypothetical protein
MSFSIEKGRHLGILKMTGELFVLLLQPGSHPAYEVVENGLPEGARITNARLGWTSELEVVLEHPDFPLVLPGAPIPELPLPMLRRRE